MDRPPFVYKKKKQDTLLFDWAWQGDSVKFLPQAWVESHIEASFYVGCAYSSSVGEGEAEDHRGSLTSQSSLIHDPRVLMRDPVSVQKM